MPKPTLVTSTHGLSTDGQKIAQLAALVNKLEQQNKDAVYALHTLTENVKRVTALQANLLHTNTNQDYISEELPGEE